MLGGGRLPEHVCPLKVLEGSDKVPAGFRSAGSSDFSLDAGLDANSEGGHEMLRRLVSMHPIFPASRPWGLNEGAVLVALLLNLKAFAEVGKGAAMAGR
ncbi:MAG: hypothetical protein JWR68_731 [Polaromonas sp.]|nr:hypothetical protein [Polaromonas sp.]